ncbi:MAG: M56 family metallopeptidase, partial [Gemmatimonadota bacterium]|nr:M56 family metallopeptidase [Gemmatimonadota bacterium]
VWAFASSAAVVLIAMAPIAPNVPVSIVSLTPPAVAEVVIATATDPSGSYTGEVARKAGDFSGGDFSSTLAGSRPLTRSVAAPSAFAQSFVTLRSQHPGAATLAGVWVAGSLAVLLWIVMGHLGLALLARRAIPAVGDDWPELLAEAAKRNNVTRAIRFGLSDSACGPVTWGWLRPVVLFPAVAASWPVEQKRAALTHEMAHVARSDYLTQLVASIACCLYWFNPLAWLAARRLRSESELACDDRVIAGGTAPTDYAVQLLGVARQARELRLGGFVAVSMARPSHLEGRLLAVLDASRPRGVTSPRMRLAIAIAFGTILVPFAGLRPVPVASAAPAQPVASPDQATATSFESNSGTRAPFVTRRSSEGGGAAREVGSGPGDESMKDAGQFSAPIRAVQQAPSARVADDSSFERSERAAPGELLNLDLMTGGSVEIRGSDEAMVRIRVELRGRDWKETRVEVERVDGGVRVRTAHEGRSRSYSTSHKFVVTVPRRFDVRLRSAGGGLRIVGVEGSFRGNTGGGGLVLERVSGRASLSTGGGDIDVSDSDLSGSVSTGGGMVLLSRVRGGLRGSSGSGPVIYGDGSDDAKLRELDKLQGDLQGVTVNRTGEKIGDARATGSGMLHVRKAGGPIVLGEAPHGATISTGGGDIRVGRGAVMVDAHTGGGDIEIGPVAGSVRAGTGAGKVRVTLVDAQGAEQSVEIRSGTGQVIVELPANFNGKIELETAYTRAFGRATRIESPWDLEREETTAWESNRGTPRRFVRARGVTGSGGGIVRVNTVNGDIILRRASGRL